MYVFRKVNKEVCRAMVKGLGSVIGHPEIRLDQPELYRGDGVHLSEAGLEIFLRDLCRGLHAEIFGWMGGNGV